MKRVSNLNHLAIIIAYYLAQFDKEVTRSLGYKSDYETVEKTSQKLGVRKNIVISIQVQ